MRPFVRFVVRPSKKKKGRFVLIDVMKKSVVGSPRRDKARLERRAARLNKRASKSKGKSGKRARRERKGKRDSLDKREGPGAVGRRTKPKREVKALGKGKFRVRIGKKSVVVNLTDRNTGGDDPIYDRAYDLATEFNEKSKYTAPREVPGYEIHTRKTAETGATVMDRVDADMARRVEEIRRSGGRSSSGSREKYQVLKRVLDMLDE